MTSTSLVKTQLHNSIADSLYKEISSRTGRYYYFLGKAIAWTDEDNPPIPIDSFAYEKDTRKNIILVKEILSSDVAFVVDRKDWVSGTVYDIYDDQYCTEVIGLNLIAGGTNYSSNANITISGGTGSGATGNVTVVDGSITNVNILTTGSGYTTRPNVIISHVTGTGGNIEAVIGQAYSGVNTLQAANFYVVTDQFNIYKCLDNNNNAKSTVKPTETSSEAFFTSDNYKWKFMGIIPIFLRNKFLSPTFMPVTTSINSNFYSKGEIKSVNILDTGSGYTFASIVVQGDGYLENEPFLVKNVNINYSGIGYANAIVVIDPPITATSIWAANTTYTKGKILSHEKNYYEVILAGTSASYGPIHTVGIKQNGNVGLKFKGTVATANATLSNGLISSVVLDGASVRDIVITKGGSGYISAPTISLTGGGGVNAAGYVNLVDNTVRRIIITDSGKNYSTAPNVIIGDEWTANTFFDVTDQIFYLTNLYTITSNGYSNTTAPTHTSGSLTLGNAIFTFAGAKATAYARLKYGAGYSSTPLANIVGDNGGNNAGNANISVEVEKTEAVLIPYIDHGGRITRVNIEDGGIGYTYGTLTVVGDGSNASLQLNLSQGDLESLQSLNELQAVSGAIHTVKVVSQGYNYSNANVTISGDGTGATANATIVSGRITKINMINEGSGYTYATVTITGSGKGASARTILPPYNGHGKDTINELFARNLGFYSTINQEENQGFVVTNDYRQFGIIKDVRNLNNSKYFNGGSGSACFLISGSVNTSIFEEDVIVRRAADNTAFLIISSSNNAILVSSLDETTPVVGDIISVSSGNSFIVTGVTEPDVDKYSGELFYIDNRRAFTTTEDQSVSLNTVIRF